MLTELSLWQVSRYTCPPPTLQQPAGLAQFHTPLSSIPPSANLTSAYGINSIKRKAKDIAAIDILVKGLHSLQCKVKSFTLYSNGQGKDENQVTKNHLRNNYFSSKITYLKAAKFKINWEVSN